MGKRIQMTFIFTLMMAVAAWAQPSTQEVTQRVDSLMQDAYAKGLFSGHVMMLHHGKNVYHKQLGFADWKTSRPIDKNTLFNIGSLNKQFTEEIIHQLVAENKLAYTDNLSKHLDLYPAEIGNKITIQQLLEMKSGLGDYLNNPKFDEIRFKDFSLNDLIAIIKTEPLLFEPGTAQEYSNSGYVVLGAVIEKVTKMSYEKNVQKRIAKPLKLKNIFYTLSDKSKQANRAHGTRINFEGNKISVDDISNATPAGGIYTTIDALLKFAEAKRKSALPSKKQYGAGIFAGGTPFWNSTIYLNDKNGYTFVVMANTGNIADELTIRMRSILKNEAYPPLEQPFIVSLYKTINEKGLDYVKANVGALAEQAGLPLDDRFLNFFGYQFLRGNKTDIALGLFKINAELYPNVPNTHDSLGEAYLKSGDKANALKCYKMALQLDPSNENAKAAIAELEK